MRPLTVAEIASVVSGGLKGSGQTIVSGVSTDSRNVATGEIFFALKGPNFDGHAFVAQVFAKGASAAVVETTAGLEGLPASAVVIVVKDTLRALGALASYVRRLYRIPFVAVTGSAGKTTTKEMIASILSRSRNVLKTEGNKNNLIGVPLTLFRLEPAHDAAVIELGISEDWEMERLVDMCAPDVAVITNIGRGHLATLGSLDGVARAKGPLYTRLGAHGVKVVNLDDPWVVKAAGAGGASVTYGLKQKADVSVESYRVEEGFGGVTAVYDVGGRKVEARFTTPGITNVVNGAAAIAATLALGAPLEDMAEGLRAYSPVKGRMTVVVAGGLTILDDTYNANPESMASALRTLGAARGRKVAVLGDMLELGEASESEHASIGALAAGVGVDVLVAIGALSARTAEGARSAGLRAVFDFRDKKTALASLRAIVAEGDTVLVKGSRGVALEDVVEGLKELAPSRECV